MYSNNSDKNFNLNPLGVENFEFINQLIIT